jgi:hypothetical protein
MICKQSRNELALALRRYVAGKITNDDLDDIAVDWRDRGAVAVKQMAWGLYSDLEHHRATGKHAISGEHRRTVARWIVFLHNDNEYLWPEYSFIQIINWPINLLTFGWWERGKKRRSEQFEEAGDFSAWPFVSAKDLNHAIRKPKYLTDGTRR